MKKILVVGSGLTGSVISRVLAENNFEITLIDKRDHIAGNVYDFVNDKNIRVHKYGPHLFHTNNKKVVDFIKRFSEWVDYKHRVKAILEDGRYVTLPVNTETKKIVGEKNIISTFFRPYSEKMWGLKLEEISPDIINRVPIRDDNNEYYFPNDKYQFLPKEGYTVFVKNILDHKKINIKLSTPFKREMEDNYDYIFNSMPIDEYYNYKFGNLKYRSIKFRNIDFPSPKLLPVTTVNFTHHAKFTRMTEWKHLPFHGLNDTFTTITIEEPCSFEENNNEKYYPVKDVKGVNRSLYLKYKNIENKKVQFVGRLGMYSYLNMDQCISHAMKSAENFIRNKII
ncbi:MAG: NAD(P)-binding protein [Flavobacteriaceae bacterium]|jgi:UDP-galactopyranose mutase|nr:NAD(P)-binding protein [Flavobacteriaceae bacterium]